MSKFVDFPKIARYNKPIIITEKIDGTNAQIYISFDDPDANTISTILTEVGPMSIWAGSRKKWITPEKDNYGFAKWVRDNAEELLDLGPGRHFGEWWGQGIQRGYNQTKKNFSLFNTVRWNADNPPPACCQVVPVLYEGLWTINMGFDEEIKVSAVDWCMGALSNNGSYAAPGFMNPEGIVIFHTASLEVFKVTFEYDTGKWSA